MLNINIRHGDLRFNRIRSIDPGTFSELKNINTMLLSDNHITVVHNGAFNGLSNIRHLTLYKNRIEDIEERAFHGMPRLEQLYLHHNRIKFLRPHVFDSLTKLERLFLHDNKLERIQPGIFSKLNSLVRLRLDGNALVCDCGMMMLKKLMTRSNGSNTLLAATCEYPSSMAGKSISDMDDKDFSCKEPRILEDPHDVEVSFGGTAVFTCRVDGDPLPEVTWMLNSNEIDVSDPKYTLGSDGTLVVSTMSVSDVGKYECMAKSPVGEVKSKPAVLISSNLVTPLFDRQPEDQVANQGDTVQLECSVLGNSYSKVHWYHNDQPVTHDRARVSVEGTLTIENVHTSDAGTYKCVVDTLTGRVSVKAHVSVNERPRIISAPESQSVRSGTGVELRCIATGTPTPVISWYKDGNSLLPSNRISFERDSTIVKIRNSQESDSGLYTCAAQNLEGMAEANGELRVRAIGPRPPRITLSPYPLVVPLGTSVEMPCRAQGEPTPEVTWTKDGNRINIDDTHRIFPAGSLRIYNVSHEDAGLYMCIAGNEYGETTARASLQIEGDITVDDNLVIKSVEEAKQAVDSAVNSTINNVLYNRRHGSHPSALMRLFRYPDAETRAFVRAADVYEKTLINIRKHIKSGLQVNETEDFSYEDILTPSQLRLIAELSGCMEHQTPANCSDMCFHTKYRTIDGTCNNFQNPYWGASHTGFRRLLRPAYENGFSTPVGWNKRKLYHGFRKPPARKLSLELIRTKSVTADSEITHMVMQWGQFLDHDLDHAIPSTSAESWEGLDCKKSCDYSPPCFPMEVPAGDPRIKNRRCMDFIRSSAVCGSGLTSVFFDKLQPREQINQLTAFIDGSQVYGFTVNRSRLLRDHITDLGLLRVGIPTKWGTVMLPIAGSQEVDCRRDPTESDVGCFLAGDIRVNEQASLVAMHTIWLREHNRIVLDLKEVNPHWPGDTLFNEARKILGAEMQHITYEHWLPHVLGATGMEMLGKYETYNPNLEPSISNEFATAALRFGHTLINPVLTRLDENFNTIPQGDLPLGKAFFSPWRVVEEGGVDPLMRGMFWSPAKLKRPGENLNEQLTDHLFTSAHAVALDLASMNIQRGRDHGLPSYNDYRVFCNLSRAKTFDELQKEISDAEIRIKLAQLYGHPENIDLFVGGILEDQVDGAKVGPTFRCLLVEQFRRIRDGDRFWYENPGVFKPSQLVQIRQSSLSRVLCDNGDNITQVTSNVFILPHLQSPKLLSCDKVPKVDLRFWYECEGCEPCSSTRGRRAIEDEQMHDRVDDIEMVLNELQQTVKNLKRRVRQLSKMSEVAPTRQPKHQHNGGCQDSEGRKRKDGDTWLVNPCTMCECEGTRASCKTLECPLLSCERQIIPHGKCCPVCA